jgi:hypothetical protein
VQENTAMNTEASSSVGFLLFSFLTYYFISLSGVFVVWLLIKSIVVRLSFFFISHYTIFYKQPSNKQQDLVRI